MHASGMTLSLRRFLRWIPKSRCRLVGCTRFEDDVLINQKTFGIPAAFETRLLSPG